MCLSALIYEQEYDVYLHETPSKEHIFSECGTGCDGTLRPRRATLAHSSNVNALPIEI